jgi:hypothetical protein
MAGTSGGNVTNNTGVGGTGSGGNILNLTGTTAGCGLVLAGAAVRGNMGGSSMLGGSVATGADSTNGVVGISYGGGGGGTRNGASQAARAGAAGAPGIVLVDVFI